MWIFLVNADNIKYKFKIQILFIYEDIVYHSMILYVIAEVKFAEIKMENGKSQGWGLVRFGNADDAQQAICILSLSYWKLHWNVWVMKMKCNEENNKIKLFSFSSVYDVHIFLLKIFYSRCYWNWMLFYNIFIKTYAYLFHKINYIASYRWKKESKFKWPNFATKWLKLACNDLDLQ